ncbi:MAG: hypothetical protein IJS78_05670 [Clostridia bacterium]|nr:hypothetical protein [Clostridia bacterium]
MTIRKLTGAAALFLLLCSALLLFSCGKETPPEYKLDFSGKESGFSGAKASYREGETVTFYFPLTATDTDYSFFVDGEPFDPDYSDGDGFIFTFPMPAHDVKVDYTAENTSVYRPEIVPDVLLIDYYTATVGTDGCDSYHEAALYTATGEYQKLLIINGGADGEETVTEYHVPPETSEKCFRVIFELELDRWDEEEDRTCLDGSVTTVKYRFGDDYKTASTNDMPYGGEGALDSVGRFLERYAAGEYLAGKDGQDE